MRCSVRRRISFMPRTSSSKKVTSWSWQPGTPQPWSDTSSWWAQRDGEMCRSCSVYIWHVWHRLSLCNKWQLLFCCFSPSMPVQQHALVLRAQIQPGRTQVHRSDAGRHWWDESSGNHQWGLPSHLPGFREREDFRATSQVQLQSWLLHHPPFRN